ncbi:MAG TPA: Gfo/Idh/MocA family oxidoreductase [Gemmataceae bacterium]|nr:Gfo/Idh/MocA family oxidoreductase [Gemmataceae bacterium]
MTKKLRWGILGVASINDRLFPSFAKANNVELRAIASRSPEKAKAAAKAAGIPVAHGSYEALLDDKDIDVIYNPLPNTLHDQWTRKAAERGKHVLCEKPLCPTAAEAQALVEFCRGKGVKLLDGFMWPHHPRTQRLRQLIDSGAIGEVQRVAGSFTWPMRPIDPTNIRIKRDMAGGSLLDVGCYCVYGIRWAFGAEPVKVYATSRYQHDVDTEMNGLVWLADGRVGAFDCSFTMPMRQWLEITGTDGVIRVHDMWLPAKRATWTIERIGGEPEVHAVDGEDQIQHMLEGFSRSILEGSAVRPDPSEAVKTLRVLDALAASARNGDVRQV